MKKSLFLLCIIINSLHVISQTNVSGGIYTNTTWTKANSPYTVVSNVVVFPGVVLTIQPGVTVKFNNGVSLEIRQAQLIAAGLSNDSIKFLSSSSTPTPGIWSQIWINGGNLISKLNYCHIQNASEGIYNHNLIGTSNTTAVLSIKNSVFFKNQVGISAVGNGPGYTTVDSSVFSNNNDGFNGSEFIINACYIKNNINGVFLAPYAFTYNYIKNSTINSNQYGLTGSATTGAAFYSMNNSTIDSNSTAGIILGGYPSTIDSIINCKIRNNPFGVLDSFGSGLSMKKSIIENNIIGLKFKGSNKTLICNKICSNSSFNMFYNVVSGSNLNIPNNSWCSTNTITIGSKIWDGYDDINLGLVIFSPVDSLSCYLSTGIDAQNFFNDDHLKIFPNPTNGSVNLKLNEHFIGGNIQIFDAIGKLIQTQSIKNTLEKIDLNLNSGIYFIKASTKEGISKTEKLVVE